MKRWVFVITAFSILPWVGCVSRTSASENLVRAPSSVEIVRETRGLVAKIEIKDVRDSSRRGIGTGVWVRTNLLLTNYHVVERLVDTAFVKGLATFNSLESSSIKKIVARDEKCDLALVAVDSPASAMLRATAPQVGGRVVVWGTPDENLAATWASVVGMLRVEQVSKPKTEYEQADCSLVQLSTTVYPGMSGGPVFNLNGELVGLASSSFDRVLGSGYAISGSEIDRFLKNY